STVLASMNFTPLPGQCQGPAQNLSQFATDVAYNLDFNGTIRPSSDAYSGAYEGSGTVATNQPPTVAQAAKAAANPVTGTSTTLSVLGADDGGEAKLTYRWTVTSGTGAVFSANGSNAAKSTAVTFNKAGAYTFQVTITDAGGLSVTSGV